MLRVSLAPRYFWFLPPGKAKKTLVPVFVFPSFQKRNENSDWEREKASEMAKSSFLKCIIKKKPNMEVRVEGSLKAAPDCSQLISADKF